MLTELTKYNALCENVYVLVIKNAASIEFVLCISRALVTYFNSKAEN